MVSLLCSCIISNTFTKQRVRLFWLMLLHYVGSYHRGVCSNLCIRPVLTDGHVCCDSVAGDSLPGSARNNRGGVGLAQNPVTPGMARTEGHRQAKEGGQEGALERGTGGRSWQQSSVVWQPCFCAGHRHFYIPLPINWDF